MPPQHTSAMQSLRKLNEEMLTSGEFPLAANATQAVFGAGPVLAKIMLLGEQPGDQEDVAGQPFVGPAGRLLDQALHEAGVERSDVYVTNSLKHFKFNWKGSRRQHRSPDLRDLKLYLPWLEREIEIVQPQVIVALGAIAARAVTGKTLGLEVNRGKLLSLANGRQVVLTYHPSFLLRTPDKATKQLRYERLVADLKLAAEAAASND